ncbi:uncharacterized protein LOC143838104 [Paroedura picta]|uniref:uncharacterized protein LOC143838104 n=1 Tax=Paroedura picta TaxID=143630 RepID=UPI0040560181
MDKRILLLIITKSVFQAPVGLECGETEKPARAIFLEWPKFPEGKDPEFYVVKYQQSVDFIQKTVKSVSTTQLTVQNFTILLEEEKKYDVMVQSLKKGEILHVVSFKTRAVSQNTVQTLVTSTSVLFNWPILDNNFSVGISHNNVSQIFKHNETFYEWTDLRPATLYTFAFEFKQLQSKFMNVSQTLDIQVETGLCSEGWTAFKQSCYKVSKESMPWSMAQQNCQSFASGAHLVDVKNKEEHAFLFAYLQSFSQIIMLWTGLNDIKVEGHQLWTDESPYLGKSILSSLPRIPENETDCFAFQRNPDGPYYSFLGFFCYIPLPYMCEYELPSVPKNITFKVQDISTTHIVLFWSSLDGWFNSGFELAIKYYLNYSEQHIRTFSVNSTHANILELCPGHLYRFSLSARSPEGAEVSLHPLVTVETSKLHKAELIFIEVYDLLKAWCSGYEYQRLTLLIQHTAIWVTLGSPQH